MVAIQSRFIKVTTLLLIQEKVQALKCALKRRDIKKIPVQGNMLPVQHNVRVNFYPVIF